MKALDGGMSSHHVQSSKIEVGHPQMRHGMISDQTEEAAYPVTGKVRRLSRS
jgi:hypothetical protein